MHLTRKVTRMSLRGSDLPWLRMDVSIWYGIGDTISWLRMNVSNDKESEIQNADHILIVLEAISPLKKIPDKSLLNQITYYRQLREMPWWIRTLEHWQKRKSPKEFLQSHWSCSKVWLLNYFSLMWTRWTSTWQTLFWRTSQQNLKLNGVVIAMHWCKQRIR
jgi:hypothetical protein